MKRRKRPRDVVALEESIISFFIEAGDLIGAPASVAAIYGIIFASPAPIGFAEIQDRLDISAGSLSQGLKTLKTIEAIKTAEAVSLSAVGGGNCDPKRRDFYIPNLEARKFVASWLDQKLEGQLDLGTKRLRGMLRQLPSEYSGTLVRGRLEHLENWHSKAYAMLPIVKGFLNAT